MGGIGVFEEVADDGAFEEGFGVVLQRRHEAAGVEGEEVLAFVVWVYLWDFRLVLKSWLL